MQILRIDPRRIALVVLSELENDLARLVNDLPLRLQLIHDQNEGVLQLLNRLRLLPDQVRSLLLFRRMVVTVSTWMSLQAAIVVRKQRIETAPEGVLLAMPGPANGLTSVAIDCHSLDL